MRQESVPSENAVLVKHLQRWEILQSGFFLPRPAPGRHRLPVEEQNIASGSNVSVFEVHSEVVEQSFNSGDFDIVVRVADMAKADFPNEAPELASVPDDLLAHSVRPIVCGFVLLFLFDPLLS